jgi:hypothetical protein
LSRSKGGRACGDHEGLAEPRGLCPAKDRDALFSLADRSIEPARLVQALIRRLVAIQDRASEAEQLALVRQIRSLLGRGPASH